MARAIERRAAEIGADCTPLDFVCDWIRDGKTLVELTNEIAEEAQEKVPRAAISNWIRARYGEAGETALAEARLDSAHALAEDAVDIVDNAFPSREGLQHAKMRSDTRLWLAERYNRKQFGNDRAANVTVNLSVLHVDALRKRRYDTALDAAPAPANIEPVSDRHALPGEAGLGAIAGAIGESAVDVTLEESTT